jgi:hypothetical protein
MSVADNDAGTKNCQAGKTDAAHSIFLHAHYPDIAKPAAGCTSYRRKQAELGDSGVMATACKGTDNTEFESLQFFFAPAHRSRTDTDTAHGASGTLAQHFAGNGGSALSKVSGAGIKNNIAHSRSRSNRLSGDHHNFPAFRNCKQPRDGGTADLSCTTEDHCSEILIHKVDLCLGEDATAPFIPKWKHTW